MHLRSIKRALLAAAFAIPACVSAAGPVSAEPKGVHHRPDHRVVESPWDLRNHNCLTYRLHLGRTIWRFIDRAGTLIEVPVLGSLRSDNGQALITAAKAGLGVAMMQEWSIREELQSGALVRLLSEYRASHIEFENGIYAVFQHGRQMPSKVRVFVDYIAAYLKERLG